MAEIYILGSMNTDTTYYLDTLPQKGVTLMARQAESAPGGKGFNQAAAAAWGGAKVHIIGAAGDDANGARLTATLNEHGVDTSYVRRVGAPTGSAVIFVDAQGNNLIVVNGGANREVKYDAVRFNKGDWLLAQLETPAETVLEYFRAARTCGVFTALNLSPAQPVDKELLSLTDMLIVNEHEASAVLNECVKTSDDVLRLGNSFFDLGIKAAVVTLGGEGAVVLERGGNTVVHGERVHTVDTQGAGDAFAGVLLAKLIECGSLCEAARHANHIAAKCVTVKGSTVISLAEVEKE